MHITQEECHGLADRCRAHRPHHRGDGYCEYLYRRPLLEVIDSDVVHPSGRYGVAAGVDGSQHSTAAVRWARRDVDGHRRRSVRSRAPWAVVELRAQPRPAPRGGTMTLDSA